jgi:hypothetical protein
MEVFEMRNVTLATSEITGRVRRSSALCGIIALAGLVFVAGCGESRNSFTAPTALVSDLDSHSSGNVKLPNPTVTADVSTCEHVTFSWNNVAVSGHVAQRWHIQLDDAPDFSSVLFNDAQYASTSYGPIALAPGTYWFRIKAMSTESRVQNSDFVVISFTVVECSSGCTLTQGYWKNHSDDWPVSGLTLGTVAYTTSELLSIYGAPVAGNGLISLAHQLIAAKLNIANGANPSAISGSITAADALIGSLVVPPVGSGSLEPSATSALVTALTNFNEGITGPGHCESQ